MDTLLRIYCRRRPLQFLHPEINCLADRLHPFAPVGRGTNDSKYRPTIFCLLDKFRLVVSDISSILSCDPTSAVDISCFVRKNACLTNESDVVFNTVSVGFTLEPVGSSTSSKWAEKTSDAGHPLLVGLVYDELAEEEVEPDLSA